MTNYRRVFYTPIYLCVPRYLGFPCSSVGKESACSAEDLVWPLGWEDPLEKEMATHSSTLAWKISWTEEPGGLQSMGLQSWARLTLTYLPSYLHGVCMHAQSCQTLCNPTDCNPSGSSVHGIIRGRILGWVVISFSRGSSQPWDQTQVSHW